MSTTTGPNLAPAKAAVERLMDDTCTITRDPQGEDDSQFDGNTGQLFADQGDPEPVWTGRCKVSSAGLISGTHGEQEGGATVNARIYEGAIPIDAPEILIGDVLTLESSRRDLLLVGKQFRVTDVRYGSFSVSRKFVLELRQ